MLIQGNFGGRFALVAYSSSLLATPRLDRCDVNDVPLPGRIESPGDYDLYTFTLTERTRVRLQATEIPPDGSGGWSPCLYLYPDAGGVVAQSPIAGGCDSYHPGIDLTLDAGTYYALVHEQNNYILGDYEFLYQLIGG